MRRVVVALALAAAAARWPGAHRGFRGMSEEQRAAAYKLNGYEWPPPAGTAGWPPRQLAETAAYRQSRDELETWIRRDVHEYKATFDEFSTLAQSRLLPRFTPRGFDRFDFSQDAMYTELARNYRRNVKDPAAFERLSPEKTRGSAAPVPGGPKFYSQRQLNDRLLNALRPRMEAWAGVELLNGQAYGVRVYRNGSTLVNHVDRAETHVISAIVHIDHDLDEDWPLEIEDHDGAWHAVNLAPGEVVMYESAKQYHARLRPLFGRAYASVFLHWYPKHDWNWTKWDTHCALPPDFEAPPTPALHGSRPPPFIRAYHDYWRGRGVEEPELPRGIENAVQSFTPAAKPSTPAAATPTGAPPAPAAKPAVAGGQASDGRREVDDDAVEL
ncbi:hypothetical protein M885DRAFT_550244 [Pelagophyceae sp. CCMP2097]|nr:hypothetical protein M885DRAFT_550244 [Pelagophyceae sp. CCMP2097]